jgi:hypothetical protein
MNGSNVNATSDDEFDNLPDPFAGIDFDTVPELRAPSSTSLCAPVATGPTPATSSSSTYAKKKKNDSAPARTSSSHDIIDLVSSSDESSTDYSFDDIDAEVLAELDAIESRLTQPGMHGNHYP